MAFIKRSCRNGKVYLSEVENHWIDGKCVQKHLRYLGKEVDGQAQLSVNLQDLEVKAVKLHGPLQALHHLAQSIHLDTLLGDHAPEILSMVYAHCLNYKSLNHMIDWFQRTDLAVILKLSHVTEKKLLSALDDLESKDIDHFQYQLFETISQHLKLDSKTVVYDVTNTYLYGSRCPLAKRGLSKDGKRGRPLIQVALAVTQDAGIPLFHEVFEGNVHDSRTLDAVMLKAHRYDLKRSLVIYDRGIASAKNIRHLKEMGLDTLCGLSSRRAVLDAVRQGRSGKSWGLRERVVSGKTILYAWRMPYVLDDIPGFLVVCYNPRHAMDLRESRYEKLMETQEACRQGDEVDAKIRRCLGLSGNIVLSKVKALEEFDGYSFLFSTRRMDAREAVRLYFDKDIVEKSFRCLKGVTHLRPIRHWLHGRVKAHILICYIAYALLAVLKEKVKGLDLSAEKALHALESMYSIYLRDSRKNFHFSRTVVLQPIQKEIFKAIGKKLNKPSGQK